MKLLDFFFEFAKVKIKLKHIRLHIAVELLVFVAWVRDQEPTVLNVYRFKYKRL